MCGGRQARAAKQAKLQAEANAKKALEAEERAREEAKAKAEEDAKRRAKEVRVPHGRAVLRLVAPHAACLPSLGVHVFAQRFVLPVGVCDLGPQAAYLL